MLSENQDLIEDSTFDARIDRFWILDLQQRIKLSIKIVFTFLAVCVL